LWKKGLERNTKKTPHANEWRERGRDEGVEIIVPIRDLDNHSLANLSLCSLKLRLATATITSIYVTTFYFVLFVF
jgi:hypothetical protein